MEDNKVILITFKDWCYKHNMTETEGIQQLMEDEKGYIKK